MDNENRSKVELVLELERDLPELVSICNEEQYRTLWEEPEAVLKQYKASIKFYKESLQMTDEQVNELCRDTLADACTTISDLKANGALNEQF